MGVKLAENNVLSFDAYTLKLIAIVAMVIDHAGYMFFDNWIVTRMIGRLTLPIMAFFITEGYRKTRNLNRYMLRLAIFAVVSMIPFWLVSSSSPFNILFNLLFGLTVLYITEKLDREWLKWCVVVLFASVAFLLHFDGIYTTVPLIYLMNKYRDNFSKMFISTAILLFGISFAQVILGVTGVDPSYLTNMFTWIRPLALVSYVFIYHYNGQRGKDARYFFYSFYPAHLLVLYFIQLVLTAY